MLESLKRWLSDAGLTIASRSRSPLWSSFVVSWLVFNWEVPIYLFTAPETSDLSVVIFIRKYIDSNSFSVFLGPAITALTYAIFGSAARNFVDTAGMVVKSAVEKMRAKVLDGRVVPWSEVRPLREAVQRYQEKDHREHSELVSLRSSYQTLQEGHETVLQEKEKLLAEVKDMKEKSHRVLIDPATGHLKTDNAIGSINYKLRDIVGEYKEEILKTINSGTLHAEISELYKLVIDIADILNHWDKVQIHHGDEGVEELNKFLDRFIEAKK